MGVKVGIDAPSEEAAPALAAADAAADAPPAASTEASSREAMFLMLCRSNPKTAVAANEARDAAMSPEMKAAAKEARHAKLKVILSFPS